MTSMLSFLLLLRLAAAVHAIDAARSNFHQHQHQHQHNRRSLQQEDGVGVTYRTSTHRLYYVPSAGNIDYSAVGIPASDYQDVPAYELENNKGVRIMAMAQGATLVELSLPDDVSGGLRTNYLWDNVEGATYYGSNTNNFPLKRGLIVNGGVRFTAVAPEHGLYYDVDWDVDIDDSNPDEKSIVLSIVDSEENRNRAANSVPSKPANSPNLATTGFSSGQFSSGGGGDMSKYPTTDMEFRLTITLRKDEDFVRLRMSVTNPDAAESKWGEAWLPMTFPINEESVILSKQRQRWRRDSWCLDNETPNVVEWTDYPFLHRPLDWPMGCIFYDIPSMEGNFHGVTTVPDEGKGVVYYTPEESEHYTKVWSWGKQGADGNDLEGRPASNYYEPWSGGTNFAFFQTRAFKPLTELSWEVAILPIAGGLTNEKDADELLDYVETYIEERMDRLGDVQRVETRGIGIGSDVSGGDGGYDGDSSSEKETPAPVISPPSRPSEQGATTPVSAATSSSAASPFHLAAILGDKATWTTPILLSSFVLLIGLF